MKSIILRTGLFAIALLVPSVLFAADAAPVPAVRLYGFTKLDVIYATQRTYVGDLNFYLLPAVAGQDQASWNITARETRFGLDLAGPVQGEWKATGRIELDFYTSAFGGSNENAAAPRIRLAYADLANADGFSVRAGQDWDAFVTVLPRTVDGAVLGGFGNLYNRRPQVRLTQVVTRGKATITARAAAARTTGQVTDAGGVQDGGTDAAAPLFEGALFVDAPLWTRAAARLSVSGHTGTETVAPVAADPALKTYPSRSLIAGLVLPVTETVAVQGTYWQGADLRQFFGGVYQGINTTLGRSIEAQGGWAQLVANITPSLDVNLGYGYDDPDDDDLNTNDRTFSTRSFGSVFLQVFTATTVAVEYSRVSTGYKSAATADGNIYQASVVYKF